MLNVPEPNVIFTSTGENVPAVPTGYVNDAAPENAFCNVVFTCPVVLVIADAADNDSVPGPRMLFAPKFTLPVALRVRLLPMVRLSPFSVRLPSKTSWVVATG